MEFRKGNTLKLNDHDLEYFITKIQKDEKKVKWVLKISRVISGIGGASFESQLLFLHPINL